MPTIEEINRELANQVVAEAKQNPQAYPGKYIGIANGKVVIVSDDLDAIDDKLDEVEPDATKTYIVDLTLDENQVHEIWRLFCWPAPDGHCLPASRLSKSCSPWRRAGRRRPVTCSPTRARAPHTRRLT